LQAYLKSLCGGEFANAKKNLMLFAQEQIQIFKAFANDPTIQGYLQQAQNPGEPKAQRVWAAHELFQALANSPALRVREVGEVVEKLLQKYSLLKEEIGRCVADFPEIDDDDLIP
jgi:hypothetical protein